jgi:sporulation protein YlmC with PRC-barrel domain
MQLAKTCTLVISLLSLLLATTSFAAQQKVEGVNSYRGSKLIGDDVENAQGEDLGKIEDIVFDRHDGRMTYAVLSFGGFLGLGEKYFAIPWNALTTKAGEENTLILNVDKERLKNAPGFDKNHWPNMADRTWGQEIHTYYGTQPYWEREALRQEGKDPLVSPTVRSGRVGESLPGMRDGEAVTATILNVNTSTKSLQLKTASGEIVELKAPEGLLSELQTGDRVEVVIRKQAKIEQSPMGQPGREQPSSGQPGDKAKSQN